MKCLRSAMEAISAVTPHKTPTHCEVMEVPWSVYPSTPKPINQPINPRCCNDDVCNRCFMFYRTLSLW